MIETHSRASMPQVKFDRDVVMQIVINLLDNAIKYARQAQDKRIIVRSYEKWQQVFDRGGGSWARCTALSARKNF